jgi:hypothetical protein
MTRPSSPCRCFVLSSLLVAPPVSQQPQNNSPEPQTERQIERHTYSSLPRHPLVVCASLVQNPTNLGGLCRTAEAFRLEALVLADLKLAQNPLFRAVAVSSHHWQPLQSCGLAELPTWLQQQRQRGYTLLTLEAHPQALPLPGPVGVAVGAGANRNSARPTNPGRPAADDSSVWLRGVAKCADGGGDCGL